ncbi:MAG: MFS transporter [Victivallales bacterium]|nr:MFS transporter [Victivallales bacterium]
MTELQTNSPLVDWRQNLVFIWISQFLAMIGFGCCMPFIPLMLRQNLHIEDEHLRGLYMSIYYLASMSSLCVATAVWGMLADRFGRKIMLLRASYAAALFYPMLAFAPNFWTLVIIRFICSFFSGTVNPAQILLVSTTPSEKHGFVLGTISTAIWSGDVLGYCMGGLMVHFFGYTTAFVTCGVIYFISGLLVHFFVKEDFEAVRRLVREKKAKNQKKPFREFATPGVLWLLALFLIMGIARRIDTPYVAMLVEKVCGLDKAAFFTGIIQAAAAIGGVLAGICIGHFCDRFKPQLILVPIIIIATATTLLQAYSTTPLMLIIARFLTYFASGGIQPALQLMIAKITATEMRGTFFGWAASLQTAGGIFCSLLGGAITYYLNIRGIFVTGAIITFLMLPMLLPTARACEKEKLKE